MATIGTATLQIIPSLLGVTEAIEKQVAGKVVNVTIEPQVDTRTAQKAGKQAGEVVTKEVNAAVRKGNIGKTVGDEIASSAKKSSGKEAAKAIVDGIADGVKQEMPRGGVGEAIVDGIADGVKQGIDGVGIGGEVVTTISTGIKSGNLGGTIKDALIPAVKGIGDEIRSSAADWAGNIGDALRSGDIQGATDNIATTVRNTTDLISDIGSTFGLQIDGVREFGDKAATSLSEVGDDIQGVITKATHIYDTLNTVGNVLDTVLPRKAATGTGAMAKSWLSLIPVIGQVIGAWEIGKTNPFIQEPLTKPDGSKVIPNENGTPGVSIAPNGKVTIYDKDGKQLGLVGGGGGFGSGGYTGMMPMDKIAGVVHGGEYVIKASSTSSIQNAMPGLLDYLNGKGALPGYASGGLVAGTAELGKIIAQKFGISNIGGWRPADKYGEHATGRALDVMTTDKATGDAVKDFAIANASAIDLKWAIWQQKLWYPDGSSKAMPDRGSPRQNHMDHVHIFSGTGIVNGLRGALAVKDQAAQGMGAQFDPTGISAPDQTSLGTGGQAMTAPGGGGSSVSLASSFSGLAATGLNQLGAGVGKTQSGSDLSLFGKAGGAAVSGQVSSALGAFGINDAPGWLKGISTFASGISVGKGGGEGMASASPLSATNLVPQATSAVAGIVGGGQGQPAPQVNYNIRTATVEDAVLVTQRREKERAAATLGRY